MRIGPLHNYVCAELILCGRPLTYVSSIKYMLALLHVHAKLKFYRAFNALYSSSHCSDSEMVSVKLLKAYCIPLLLYSIEATAPTRYR